MKFDKFDPKDFQTMVNLGMYKSDFPEDLTLEALQDCVKWLGSEDGQEYIVKAYDWWKNKEDEPEEVCESEVDLRIVQTHQLNGECGLWFTSMWLKIDYEKNGTWKWESPKSGVVFIKKDHGKVGIFRADFSTILCSAEIVSAKLYGSLEPHEGLANGDHESQFEIRDKSGMILKFSAGDLHSRGWNKARPTGFFDLTEYVRGLRE